jgi:hypothetical protein
MSGEANPPCIRGLINYEIRDEIMYFSAGDWHGCTPLRLFRQDMARAAKVIAEHDARKAEVVEFKGRDHAASSRG